MASGFDPGAETGATCVHVRPEARRHQRRGRLIVTSMTVTSSAPVSTKSLSSRSCVVKLPPPAKWTRNSRGVEILACYISPSKPEPRAPCWFVRSMTDGPSRENFSNVRCRKGSLRTGSGVLSRNGSPRDTFALRSRRLSIALAREDENMAAVIETVQRVAPRSVPSSQHPLRTPRGRPLSLPSHSRRAA